MQRILLLFPFLLTLAGVSATAQDAPRTLTVQGFGRVTTAPDLAVFDIGVTTRSPSATSGVRENSVAVAVVLEQVAALGIAVDDIRTASVSVSPVLARQLRERDELPPIVGYRISNRITVTLRDLARLGELLDTVVAAGVTDLGGLRFESGKSVELQDQALAAAMQRAQTKAQRLSDAAGVELGPLLSVTERGAAQPGPVFALRALAESAVPIAPGQLAVEASVTAVFALR